MTNTNYDDFEIIIQGCIRKNEKFREILYKRFFGYALSVAQLYNNNRTDAIEVVDDSFLKVFKEIGRFDTSQSFKSWLRKIVINTSIDKFRRNIKHRPFTETEVSPQQDYTPGIISELTAKDIISLLKYLPEIHKTVFCLYEIEGFSHEEISRQLNIPESSSRVYLTRSKKRLRELFEIFFNTNHK